MAGELSIGIIGGSGLYEMEGLTRVERVEVQTPYGPPSDALIVGWLGDRRMVFLPRHGIGHRILPHEINFRANLWALKRLGVSMVVSVSAVGSMKEDHPPGTMVFADQFIDLTKRRISSFFGDGVVAHVGMADPVSAPMRELLYRIAVEAGFPARRTGTYVCIEGPQFSTRAESLVYRSWGVDVIGMTNMPEAKLAREAELSYATIALVTDYDCWHHEEAPVTVDAVLKVLSENVMHAKAVIRRFAELATPELHDEATRSAARTSLMTSPDHIPELRRRELRPIFNWF